MEMTAAQEVPAATAETGVSVVQAPATQWPDQTAMAVLRGTAATEEPVDLGATAIAAAWAVTRTAATAAVAETVAAAAEAGLAAEVPSQVPTESVVMAVPVVPQDPAVRVPTAQPESTAVHRRRTEPTAAQGFTVATVASAATAASAARAPAGMAAMGPGAKAAPVAEAASAGAAARAGTRLPTPLPLPVRAVAMPGAAGAAETVVRAAPAAVVRRKGQTAGVARQAMVEMRVLPVTASPEHPEQTAQVDRVTAPLAPLVAQAATAVSAATAVWPGPGQAGSVSRASVAMDRPVAQAVSVAPEAPATKPQL
jgi:hypothetical protein